MDPTDLHINCPRCNTWLCDRFACDEISIAPDWKSYLEMECLECGREFRLTVDVKSEEVM